MALPPALTGIELFSGVGMLGEGLRAGLDHLGIAYRTACHVEREAYAAAVLVARMDEGSMDAAPVWSDVTTFDGRAFRGRVDCVVAGFPCQDLSVAGKRAGLDGHRSGLFFEVLRIADDCGSQLIFLENVAGIASATATVVDEAEGQLDERAAARVLGELADRGWNAEWLTLSASDVGASHGRERWFCVAWRSMADTGLQYSDLQQRPYGAEHSADGGTVGNASSTRLGRREKPGASGSNARSRAWREESERGSDALGDGRRKGWTEPTRRTGRPDPSGAGLPVADAGQPGLPHSEFRELRGSWRRNEGRAIAEFRCTSFLFAPSPNDPRWADIIASTPWLAPALSIEEQHDAAAAFAAAQPPLRGMADGLASELDYDHRAQRLKCCGNGVVALCAATAAVVLLQRAGLA